MIRLKIESCPDPDRLGEYVFHKNLIYIGSSADADLALPDRQAAPNHLFIEIVDGQLLAHGAMENIEFKVDGKLATKFKFLKAGSVVEAGNTAFKILLFAAGSESDKREALNKNTDELIQSRSPLLGFIKELQKELRKEV